MKRTDIERKDVFLSWTGADRKLKNKIKDYLESHGITCLESDENCSGDFRQWSREAVSACNLFLPILTENTYSSTFVPIEIEEYKGLPDHENRIVPVAESLEIYSREPWGISEYASAVFTDTEGWLDAMLHKVESLVINLLDRIYTEVTEPDYLKLIPLYRGKGIRDGQYSHASLYVPRSITEDDGRVLATPDGLVREDGLFFISGPAGSGKTSYIDEIRHAAESGTVVISLPCYKIVRNGAALEEVMFEEFVRLCGHRCFYTKEDFYRLLDHRRLVLVIDGMDEVPGEANTRRLLKKVEDYYRTVDNVSLIFTSRNPGDADLIAMKGSAPRRFTLDKLTDEQIRALSSNLFVLFGSGEKNEDFYISIKDLNDEIKTNPLLLSQLAMVYEDSGKIPETVVGIYDAVSEMTLRLDTIKEITEIPDAYSDMLRNLGSILKTFAKERYVLLSKGRSVEPERIFSRILKDKYGEESRERAEFLVDYLRNRAIMSDGEFYHKMFLEYFTAVYYYEHTFDDYDELENADLLRELFSHYTDSYWSSVIKMYLVKADSLIDAEMTETLYSTVLSFGIKDYTLLFDTCRDLIRHRTEAETVILEEIVERSATGKYSPYGVMFWYASEYDLAESMLFALVRMKSKEYFPKALALVRDAVFLFTEKFTIADITNKVSGAELFNAASAGLRGVRRGLCELFCLGTTDCTEGDDIYPRCFNIREARAFMETGSGIRGRMDTPFEDELGLYSHNAIPEHNGEFVGIATMAHFPKKIEKALNSKTCAKLCGLILFPTENTHAGYMAFVRSSIKIFYIPENIGDISDGCVRHMLLKQSFCLNSYGIRYLRSTLRISSHDTIEDYEFKRCVSLKRVTVDGDVARIGEYAFWNCISLEFIDISDNVKEIGAGAFAQCIALRSVKLPCRLTSLSTSVFFGCSSLKEINIPATVKCVGALAFASSGIKSIALPNSVVTISHKAFLEAYNLEDVCFSENITEIEEGAFSKCISLKRAILPEKLRTIGMFAFDGCSALEEVVLPDNVITVERGVFYNCPSLKNVTMPRRLEGECRYFHIPNGVEIVFKDTYYSVEEISSIDFDSEEIGITQSQFAYQRGLKKVTVPDNIKYIGSNAFKGCENLREVILPRILEHIGSNAFMDCRSLESITLVSVGGIGNNAFAGCTSLKKIVLPAKFRDKIEIIGIEEGTEVELIGGDKEFRPNFGINRIEPNEYQYSQVLGIILIPDGVKEIGASAFEDSSVTMVVFPNGLTKVGKNGFSKCYGLKEIAFSDTVEVIEEYAFYSCCASKINLPDSVTKIGEGVFASCQLLTDVIMSKGVTEIPVGGFSNCIRLEHIALDVGLTKIGSRAFLNCESIKEIYLPEGLSTIGNDSFAGCKSLHKVVVPDSVTDLGNSVFCDCSVLEDVQLPSSLLNIPAKLFLNCKSLVKTNIPENVLVIKESAFENCTSLSRVIIPNSLEIICSFAFRNCISLTEIVLNDDIRMIERGAFSGCTGLKKVNIPWSIWMLCESAFENCSSLEEIELGHHFRDIGDNAFAGCTGLKRVRISSNFKNDIKRIFGDIDPDIIEYI